MPKNPVMNVSGRKIVATTVSQYDVSLRRRSINLANESEAASIASNLALPDRILDQELKTLSGGQRRRIELARILFSGADTMRLASRPNGG